MFINQKYNWDCGAACFVNSIYFHLGKNINIKKGRELCQSTSSGGTSEVNLVNALKEFGFRETRKMEPSNPKYAYSYLKAGDIVCIDRWEHWVMVIQKLKKSVIIHDPEVGLVELKKKKFKERWKFYGSYFWIKVK